VNYHAGSLKRPGSLCVLLCLVVVILFGCTQSSLAAKDYSISDVTIQARLNADGSMDIKETRTYQFRGHFHWATYHLPTDRTGGVIDFSVGEEGRAYSRGYQAAAGTYQYDETSGAIDAKWFFDAEDETRVFTLSYRILDVVKLYQDAAVLYHKFVGTGWDRTSHQVSVTVYPPEPIDRKEVKAWAHGPLWGTIRITDEGSLAAEVESLPAKTFWEIRAVYPTNLFSEITNVIPERVVAQILVEEKIWADEANQKREEWTRKQENKKVLIGYGKWVVLILSGLGFWRLVRLYQRYGKKHKVSFPDTLYSELPSDIPPALLSHLLYRGQLGGTALVGTLLDLARRGFLKIEEEMRTKRGIFGSSQKRLYTLQFARDFFSENRGSLKEFEANLLTFIFDDLAQGQDEIGFTALKKSRSRFIRWFRQWKKEVQAMGKSQGYWEEESLKASKNGMLVGLLLVMVTILSVILMGAWALVPGISAVVLMILSGFIPRRTPEFELEVKKWKGLRKYLKKYHFRDSDSRFFLENIGRFLAYAVVLRLSAEVIKRMAELIPEGQQSTYVPWYTAHHPHADFSPAGFGEALSSLMTAATTTVSSASGTGGGASGGGGGGTGGSGGGAG
jgi:uncharacterized membrane protein